MRGFLCLIFCIAGVSPLFAAEESDRAALERWIEQQAAIQTLSADFEQWRSLKGLKEPLSSKGSLWYRAPDLFRWEVGVPPKTIILQRGKSLVMIEPPKKRFTSLSSNDSRGMLWFPLAHSREEFDRLFNVESISSKGAVCRVKILPREKRMRDVMAGMEFEFNKSTGDLHFFEIRFRDGSAMKNSFSNVHVDKRISPSVFNIDLSEYEERKD